MVVKKGRIRIQHEDTKTRRTTIYVSFVLPSLTSCLCGEERISVCRNFGAGHGLLVVPARAVACVHALKSLPLLPMIYSRP